MEMEEWVVQIQNEQNHIKEKLSNESIEPTASSGEERQRPSIEFFRVPSFLDVLDGQGRSVFSPLKTTFGPYHHGTSSCQPRERHKEICLPHFLNRTNVKTLNNIIELLRPMVDDLRKMYHELDSIWQNNDLFLQMMVLDGSYLLQIMLEDCACRCDCGSDDDCRCGRITRKSALFDTNEKSTYIRDMLLFDNQIPIQVLKVLYPEHEPGTAYWSLRQLVLDFFSLPQDYAIFERRERSYLLQMYRDGFLKNYAFSSLMGKHCLEVICGKLLCRSFCGELICDGICGEVLCRETCGEYLCDEVICGKFCDGIICDRFCGGIVCPIIYGAAKASTLKRELHKFIGTSSASRRFRIPSATKLAEADIEIKPSNAAFLTIGLEHSTLMLPQIDVNDTTTSIFHNLVLFERVHPDILKVFSSYVVFMNGLLGGSADSLFLQSKSIVHTKDPITQDDHVVMLFRGLCKNIASSVDETKSRKFHVFEEVEQKLGKRYKKNLSPWRKDLRRNYLRSPWAVISIIAALLLFILTAVQTYYTVFAYYNPN